MIWLTPEEIYFPSYEKVSAEGIIALGGDLATERLIEAYKRGVFPWYSKSEPIIWWCPDPRFVLVPSEIRISTSMQKLFKTNHFKVTYNTCFKKVISQCQSVARKDQGGTWIHDELIEAYLQLHVLGFAKSVEVWNKENQLVGGLYGVEINNIFCGESMFALESNASKYGFIEMVTHSNYSLIDCQVYTEHLESLGAKSISRDLFLEILNTSK